LRFLAPFSPSSFPVPKPLAPTQAPPPSTPGLVGVVFFHHPPLLPRWKFTHVGVPVWLLFSIRIQIRPSVTSHRPPYGLLAFLCWGSLFSPETYLAESRTSYLSSTLLHLSLSALWLGCFFKLVHRRTPGPFQPCSAVYGGMQTVHSRGFLQGDVRAAEAPEV